MYRGGAFEELQARLERGAICLLAFDVPGSTTTTLLSKPARIASGPARLARATGAQIVPAFGARDGNIPYLDLHKPIDPQSFDSTESLVDHICEVVGSEILRRPEALEPVSFMRYIWPEAAEPYAWAFE